MEIYESHNRLPTTGCRSIEAGPPLHLVQPCIGHQLPQVERELSPRPSCPLKKSVKVPDGQDLTTKPYEPSSDTMVAYSGCRSSNPCTDFEHLFATYASSTFPHWMIVISITTVSKKVSIGHDGQKYADYYRILQLKHILFQV